MDIIEAIETRISCRAYEQRPVEPEKVAALEEEIASINEKTGLHFQLYGPRANGTVIEMSPKMFAGNPPLYAALVSQDNPIDKERLGYYGEQLVLLATQLGLGTCWVASTYDRETTRVELDEGEKLHDVVPIGYAPEKAPLKQRTIRKTIRARDKKLADMWEGPQPLDEAPAWMQAAITAVHKGPSAINGQPVVFKQEAEGAPITAAIITTKTTQEHTDLGIAKLHFELAARACGVEGTWEWGDGGRFEIA
ncbi:MAG: nitroreductase family protein [Coriobacteriales bacterium]|jgi:hypothetical protein